MKEQAIRLLPKRLAELLGLELKEASVHLQADSVSRADAVIEVGGLTFVVEWKGSGTVVQVAAAVKNAQRFAASVGRRAIPLVAVPYMGPAGREICAEARVGWFDLSGNALIIVPGLRVRVDGQPNRFKGPGRPASVFAPKSSRIARWFLLHPEELLTQRDLAVATKMDEGFTSRIVAKLEADALIVRDPDGRIGVRDPNLLLDAWAESYDFWKHRVFMGHVTARSGEARVRDMAERLAGRRELYAATGLASAWLLDRFASFRLVTIYLANLPEPSLLAELGFREVEQGANTWLVVPNDEGVFQGMTDQEGVRCVHSVQSYLDLKSHPERAREAAERIRRDFLPWKTHG